MARRDPLLKAAGDATQTGGLPREAPAPPPAPQTCSTPMRLPGVYTRPRFRMRRFGSSNLLPRFFRLVWTERDEAMEEAAGGELEG